MKKLLTAMAMATMIAGTAQAEVKYDYNNPEHKMDNYCVGVVSFAKDLLYNDVQVLKDGSVWMYTIEPTADVQKARVALADLSNALILKYEYSKQFNTHYDVQATLVKQRTNKNGPEYLKTELQKCMTRI